MIYLPGFCRYDGHQSLFTPKRGKKPPQRMPCVPRSHPSCPLFADFFSFVSKWKETIMGAAASEQVADRPAASEMPAVPRMMDRGHGRRCERMSDLPRSNGHLEGRPLCGHSFCFECVRRYRTECCKVGADATDRPYPCPCCRQPVLFPHQSDDLDYCVRRAMRRRMQTERDQLGGPQCGRPNLADGRFALRHARIASRRGRRFQKTPGGTRSCAAHASNAAHTSNTTRRGRRLGGRPADFGRRLAGAPRSDSARRANRPSSRTEAATMSAARAL